MITCPYCSGQHDEANGRICDSCGYYIQGLKRPAPAHPQAATSSDLAGAEAEAQAQAQARAQEFPAEPMDPDFEINPSANFPRANPNSRYDEAEEEMERPVVSCRHCGAKSRPPRCMECGRTLRKPSDSGEETRENDDFDEE